jgi:hypothetical protein
LKKNTNREKKTMADIKISNHGSLFGVRANTERARDWWNGNVDAPLSFGGAFMVEHRYIDPIIEGMEEEGLEIEYA